MAIGNSNGLALVYTHSLLCIQIRNVCMRSYYFPRTYPRTNHQREQQNCQSNSSYHPAPLKTSTKNLRYRSTPKNLPRNASTRKLPTWYPEKTPTVDIKFGEGEMFNLGVRPDEEFKGPNPPSRTASVTPATPPPRDPTPPPPPTQMSKRSPISKPNIEPETPRQSMYA